MKKKSKRYSKSRRLAKKGGKGYARPKKGENRGTWYRGKATLKEENAGQFWRRRMQGNHIRKLRVDRKRHPKKKKKIRGTWEEHAREKVQNKQKKKKNFGSKT